MYVREEVGYRDTLEVKDEASDAAYYVEDGLQSWTEIGTHDVMIFLP